MTGLLTRVSRLVVEPAAPAPPRVVAAPGPVAVVGVSRAARVLAPLVAAARGPVVVASWCGDGAPPRMPALPALPGARRLVARLAAREVPARAAGRVVLVELPAPAREAAAAAERLEAAVAGAPVVLAVGGPREAAWDALLARCQRVLVHAADAELAGLAVARLAEQGVAAEPAPALPGPAARVAAMLGVAPGRASRALAAERGQALVLLMALLCALLVGAAILGGLARAVGLRGADQRAADLGALAGARAMHGLYPRLFAAGEQHVSRHAYLLAGRRTAAAVARANGARAPHVAFPGGDRVAPALVRVGVGRAVAEAELVPDTAASIAAAAGDEYPGPFAVRQGRRMRPDVALAFDRLARAARADGVHLLIASAFRSNAEQARLFAAHPDPTWVARPGESLHRLGTELDLGPPSAYGWLAAHAARFRFVRRYAWEAWHWGFGLNPGSAAALARRRGGDGRSAIPSFVPERWAPVLSRAAQRWNVSATLLAAQLYAESGFNPFAVSGAGAQGLAQFLPATATAYGLHDPFDGEAAIDAQAHLMRDLLRRFASVPLALAAYNAGPARVQACGCVPPIPETLAYVVQILGLMGGAGDPAPGGRLEVRLVR